MTKQVSKALHETGVKRGKNTKETGYCVELHYGTVLQTSSFLSLATTKLNRKLGRNLLPCTVPRCNSRQGRPSLNRNSLRLSIDHFHIDHNAPCLPSKLLDNHRFQFLLDITVVPSEIEGNGYVKIWGVIVKRCIMVFVKMMKT